MKKFILLFIMLINCAFAQDKATVDSLANALRNAKHDSTKVSVLLALSKIYLKPDPNISLEYAYKALVISKQKRDINNIGLSYKNIDAAYKHLDSTNKALSFYKLAESSFQKVENKKELSNVYGKIALIYDRNNNVEEAIRYYLQAIQIQKTLDNKVVLIQQMGNLGLVYCVKGAYPEALNQYLTGLRIAEEINDTNLIAQMNGYIGDIYIYQKSYNEALKYLNVALAANESIKDSSNIAANLTSIAVVLLYQKKHTESIKVLSRCLSISEKINDEEFIAASYGNIGCNYYELGNYTEALKYNLIGLERFKSNNDTTQMSISYTAVGNVYLKMKKYKEAERYFQLGLAAAQQSGNTLNVRDSYKGLSEMSQALGQSDKALAYFKEYIIYRDSLLNNENTKKMTEQKMQYDFDKKETQNKAIQEKKNARQSLIRNFLIVGVVTMLAFSVVFFRQRNKISKEKHRSDELLLNILPSEVAEELKQKGYAEAKAIESVTVLFTDFKGFTQVAEKLSPTELVKEIDTCFRAFDEICLRHNIEKIKTIGDAYMCVGGLPITNQTHAIDAVNAAMEMRDFIVQLRKEKEAKQEAFFEVRIGLHTGQVVAGIVGLNKFAYDIWGDAVNLASRMESSGEAGKINVSGTTYDLIKDKFLCTYRGKVHAKNKGEVDMYFVEELL